MPKILVIDNNIDPSSHGCADIQRCLLQANAAVGLSDFSVNVRRGPEVQYELDPQVYAGVVVSGSKTRILDNGDWIDTQMQFMRDLCAARIPTFGICYGEQLMVRALAGDEFVRTAPTCEFGFVEICPTSASGAKGIFLGLEKNYYSFCYHYDEVIRLPQEFELLGSSSDCVVHAYRHRTAPIWGVQFHPEKNLQECRASIAHIRGADSRVQIYNEAETDNLYNPEVGDTLFRNFLIEVKKARGQKL